MSDSRGMWVVHRHAETEKNLVHFALTYKYFDLSEERFHQGFFKIIREVNSSNHGFGPLNWESPDIEQIKDSLKKISYLSLMYFDVEARSNPEFSDPSFKIGVNGVQISSEDLRWEIKHSQKLHLITASSLKSMITDSVLEVHDLENQNFSAKLRLEHGLLSAENIEGSSRVKYKYWDHSKFNGLVRRPNAAFAWWEYQ